MTICIRKKMPLSWWNRIKTHIKSSNFKFPIKLKTGHHSPDQKTECYKMAIVSYSSIETILSEADKLNAEIYETNLSVSFRIYDEKHRSYIHVFYF